ncbi:hypothetical protein HOY80DRAFT_443222 [Tuber brumale]|nr:hypothetical protein HOY80DRAFT_443222 [Tuber brumale]
MSGIFYVYIKYIRETDTRRADWGRHLLTFESRWAADELFRGLQTLKNAAGANRYSKLQRVNPQLWYYDTIDGDPWWTIIYVQRENGLPEFNYKFMSVILGDADSGRNWPVFSNPTIGPDWTSGKNFYIRNRRQPDLYWYRDSGRVVVSTTRRTKFRIKDVDDDSERVLIRKDKVTIEPVDGLGDTAGYYVAKGVEGQKLIVGLVRETWQFSELFDGIGVTWSAEEGFVTGTQFATSAPDAGDEWELC